MTTEKVLDHITEGTGDGKTLKDPTNCDYKIIYPLSLETQIRKLRNSLENWKEVILPIHKLLLWEKQWHPPAIVGITTVIFMFLWLSETSLLTVISLTGLFITLCDYLVPSILSSLFKAEKWTPGKEVILESICSDIVLYKTKFEVSCATYYRMRLTNPKMYFALTILSLAFLAWIGSTFNNLFLMYLVTTLALMLPGVEHNGFNNKFREVGSKFIFDFFNGKIQKNK